MVNGVVEYPDDNGRKPYIIWEIKKAEILPERQDDAVHRISMYVNQVTCGISPSFPTISNNLALLDAFGRSQSNWGNEQGYNRSQANVRRRQYGRGGKGIFKNNRMNFKLPRNKYGFDGDDEDADSEEANEKSPSQVMGGTNEDQSP